MTQQIIKTAEAHAKERGAAAVTAIKLVAGDYSGCMAESIALYFDIIAKDTLCEGARLDIRRVKPMLLCSRCGKLFLRKPFEFNCPDELCSGEGRPTEIGREFYIDSIEIEEKSL